MAALRERSFRRLWLGQSFSALGDQLFPVAVAILVLDRGGGTTGLGFVLAARVVALLVFLLPSGVIADRWPRTWIMAGADTARALTVVGIALSPSRPAVWILRH